MSEDAFYAVTLQVIKALDSLGVPYEIGGSVASSLHGVYRLTADVDLVADLPLHKVQQFVTALGSEFYADDLAIRIAIRAKRCFNAIHMPLGLKVDIFAVKDTPFARMEFTRRVKLPFPPPSGPLVWVSSAEDIVLHKLMWFRDGGKVAQRQFDDSVGVLKMAGPRLDRDYLARWAVSLGVADLLEQAWRETGKPR